jgi:hypothetical protein
MKRVIFLAALAACGARQHQADREAQDFNCRDRAASYIATGHIAADEIGVMMDCAEAGPRIQRWKVDKQGNRVADEHPLTPSDFDKVWTEIDGTGWENLHDCTNGTLEKTDPVYVFDIKDDSNQASFSCQTREVPYPYNDITDTLDMMAAKGQGQLGDDEPADAKALDHEDMQR